MAPVLGIDLGTTNSVVCVAAGTDLRVLPDPNGNLLIPSVVSFHPAGEVLVGHPARERRLLDARNTVYSVKRLIGRPFRSPEVRRAQERFAFELCEGPTQGVLVKARGETYTLPEISAYVLGEVRRIAERRLDEPCTRAVITVPANFNELQRSATKAAGRVAGLEVLRILNEPTAAALAYGYGKGSRERIAVFDLGGGTFDITILELAGDVFEVLATAGDTFLGGDDIDLLIAEKMADAFLQHHRFDPRRDPQAFERLRAAAEWAKCQLSSENDVQLRVEELAYGDGGASLDLTFGMTRSALEMLVRPLIGRAFDVCEDAMRVAQVRPTQLDNVILVGGSTRIPLVLRMVAEYFGRAPLADIDPDLVVARGAALQASALQPEVDEETGSKRLAKVTLKRISRADMQAVSALDEELARETAGLRSLQPAFAPPKVADDAPPAASDWVPSEPPAPPESGAASEDPELGIPTDREDGAWLRSLQANYAAGAREGRASSRPPPAGEALGGRPISSFPPPSPTPALPPPRRGAPAPSSALPPPLAPALRAPLLLDVTPHTLGVETVGGFCESVIGRNAAIPVEQTKIFTTGQDQQSAVSVRIYQGESRRLDENQALGQIELLGLRQAARGEVKIGVTFLIDADGTLGVEAKDMETGRRQSVRIHLLGAASEEEIERMRERQAGRMEAR